MNLDKNAMIRFCNKIGVENIGTKREMVELLNNHFGKEFFSICNINNNVFIKSIYWNEIEKKIFSSNKKLNTELKQCAYCKKDYPANIFRSLSGSIRKHCLDCRKLLEEK